VKVFEFDEINKKFDLMLESLQKSLHYCKNLINLANNKDNLKELEDIKTELISFEEKLKMLYDENETHKEIGFESNFSNNKDGLLEALLSFLQNLFDFVQFEDNVKIKSSLMGIISKTFEILKKIVGINVPVLKIFSLFKKHR
ncbi:MAG: hypothetical protein ACI4TI_02155, partial [Christensenellales bacterium]